MTIEQAIQILRDKLSHVTREYRPEDEALDVLMQSAHAANNGRQDAERLEWLMRRISGSALRDIGVITSSGGLKWARKAIDDAMKSTDRAQEGSPK